MKSNWKKLLQMKCWLTNIIVIIVITAWYCVICTNLSQAIRSVTVLNRLLFCCLVSLCLYSLYVRGCRQTTSALISGEKLEWTWQCRTNDNLVFLTRLNVTFLLSLNIWLSSKLSKLYGLKHTHTHTHAQLYRLCLKQKMCWTSFLGDFLGKGE